MKPAQFLISLFLAARMAVVLIVVLGMNNFVDRSDPEILRNYNKAFQQRAQRAKQKYSNDILALCKLPNFDFTEVTMYEVESEDEN